MHHLTVFVCGVEQSDDRGSEHTWEEEQLACRPGHNQVKHTQGGTHVGAQSVACLVDQQKGAHTKQVIAGRQECGLGARCGNPGLRRKWWRVALCERQETPTDLAYGLSRRPPISPLRRYWWHGLGPVN